MVSLVAHDRSPKQSWRDVAPPHPAADAFPMMSRDQLRELAEDIKENGLKVPIVTWSDGTVLDEGAPVYTLDGRNRLEAMERFLGWNLVRDGKLDIGYHNYIDWAKTTIVRSTDISMVVHRYSRTQLVNIEKGGSSTELSVDPYSFVQSLNAYRRHLTQEQKREAIDYLIKAQPEAPDLTIARQTGASPTTVGKRRKKLEDSGDVSNVETRADSKGRKQPTRKPRNKATKKPAASGSGRLTDQLRERQNERKPEELLKALEEGIRALYQTLHLTEDEFVALLGYLKRRYQTDGERIDVFLLFDTVQRLDHLHRLVSEARQEAEDEMVRLTEELENEEEV